MFARQLSLHLKPNSPFTKFTRTFDRDVIPVLRKQKGFQNEITFVNPAGNAVTAISVWDQEQNADNYDHSAYAEILGCYARSLTARRL